MFPNEIGYGSDLAVPAVTLLVWPARLVSPSFITTPSMCVPPKPALLVGPSPTEEE